MKNTVLLIRNAAPSDFGGAETYPVSLAEILKHEGWNPILVSRSEKLINYSKGHGVATIRGWWWSRQNWNGRRVLLFPVYIVWQLLLTFWYISLIIRTKADTLHIQSKDDFIAGTFAGRLLGKNVTWTDHMDLRYVFQNISRPFKNPLGKFVFFAARFATHIILISDNEYRLVTSHFPKNKQLKKQVVVIKNGVIDQKDAYPTIPEHKEFTYCLASRIIASKGIGEAITAFCLLETQLPSINNLRLNIYGDGLELAHFKDLAKNQKHITFFGHQQDPLDKINQADVFILPSYQEGFSIALLEAAMLGKAIIASDVDSNSEIISDNKTGLLVEARDLESLTNAMRTLFTNNTLLHTLEKNAREKYLNNFNLVTIVKTKIIPLYSSNNS